MTTLTRSSRSRDTAHGTHLTWLVTDAAGAVTFDALLPAAGVPVFFAVGLHHAADNGLPRTACEFLAGGSCFADAAHRAGHDLGERWDVTGRDDETIFAELESWHRDRMR